MSTAAAEDTLIELVDGVVVDVTPQDDSQPTCRIRQTRCQVAVPNTEGSGWVGEKEMRKMMNLALEMC